MNVRDAVLAVAIADLGVVEVGGNNRGPRVEQYLRYVHLAAGQPWCAAAVAWWGGTGCQRVGRLWPLPRVGGCMSLYDAGRKLGVVVREAAVGAVFLKWFPKLGRFAHTGFVERPALAAGAWITIEGNTADPTVPADDPRSREGWGVFRRTREFTAQDVFLYWWPLAEPAAATQ